MGNRIQEIELMENRNYNAGTEGRVKMFRQMFLPNTHALDPIILIREIRPSLSVVALTKYEIIKSLRI